MIGNNPSISNRWTVGTNNNSLMVLVVGDKREATFAVWRRRLIFRSRWHTWINPWIVGRLWFAFGWGKRQSPLWKVVGLKSVYCHVNWLCRSCSFCVFRGHETWFIRVIKWTGQIDVTQGVVWKLYSPAGVKIESFAQNVSLVEIACARINAHCIYAISKNICA